MGSPVQDKPNQTMILYNKPVMSHTIASMEELLNSPPITLIIGPDECQTTIQSTLFRGMSRPLHTLLNSPQALNGDTTDINLFLEHDDKSAFMQLLKAAYATIVKGKEAATLAKPSKVPTRTQTSLSNAPCPGCKKKSMQLVYACLSCHPSLKQNDDDTVGLDSFFLIQFHQSLEISLAQIPTLTNTKATISQLSIDTQDPISAKPYSLLHFAQVCSLASKYEMVAVQIAALKSFYRRLKKVHASFDDAEDAYITELIDALRFLASSAFTNTLPANGKVPSLQNYLEDTREASEDDTPTLRDYVTGKASIFISQASGTQPQSPDLLTTLMRYMLVRVDDLLDNEEFREIVAENGALGLTVMEILRQGMNLTD